MTEKRMKVMIVERSPSKRILRMFLKKFFLYMLKALANTIGGKQK